MGRKEENWKLLANNEGFPAPMVRDSGRGTVLSGTRHRVETAAQC